MYRKQLKSTIYSNKTEAPDAAGNVPYKDSFRSHKLCHFLTFHNYLEITSRRLYPLSLKCSSNKYQGRRPIGHSFLVLSFGL